MKRMLILGGAALALTVSLGRSAPSDAELSPLLITGFLVLTGIAVQVHARRTPLHRDG